MNGGNHLRSASIRAWDFRLAASCSTVGRMLLSDEKTRLARLFTEKIHALFRNGYSQDNALSVFYPTGHPLPKQVPAAELR